jgi:hypothetical protein
MSIMDRIFGKATVQPPIINPAGGQVDPTRNVQPIPQSNTINTLPNTQVQQTQQTSPNGVVPEGGNKPPESPLANFADLWQPNKTDPNDPNSNPQPQEIDPAKMMEAAGKVDFTKVLSPEDLQKIQAGGEGAVQALISSLNKTAQTVFGQSTIVAAKLIDQKVATAREEFAAQIPGLVKRQNLQENFADNPAFANPALQPVVQAVTQQMQEKFPKASVKEIDGMVKEYLTGAAQMIAPPAKVTPKSSDGDNTDWEKYLAD